MVTADHERQIAYPDAPAMAESDGIARYLLTLCAVAYAPGASHWCTPGHNRGVAIAALSFGWDASGAPLASAVAADVAR